MRDDLFCEILGFLRLTIVSSHRARSTSLVPFNKSVIHELILTQIIFQVRNDMVVLESSAVCFQHIITMAES